MQRSPGRKAGCLVAALLNDHVAEAGTGGPSGSGPRTCRARTVRPEVLDDLGGPRGQHLHAVDHDGLLGVRRGTII
jgi:hypothetical protein